jgi:hypothetical protein
MGHFSINKIISYFAKVFEKPLALLLKFSKKLVVGIWN